MDGADIPDNAVLGVSQISDIDTFCEMFFKKISAG